MSSPENSERFKMGIGQYDLARSRLERALALNRELGKRDWIGKNLMALASLARRLADYETARSVGEEAVKIARELGDREDEGSALGNLGRVLVLSPDYS